MVRSTPPTGVSAEAFYIAAVGAKQGNNLIRESLSGCLIWESLVVCDWLSGFNILTVRDLQPSALFCLDRLLSH